VKDPTTGKNLRVRRDDPLLLSGYYVGNCKGSKRGPRDAATKEKLRIASSKPHPKACCIKCKEEMSAHRVGKHHEHYCKID
jgi:hypothetical protein